MRTTVELSDDTAAAVDRARRDLGIGVSEAVNELIRRGLMPREGRHVFRQRTRRLGLRVDVSNVSAALEDLEGVESR